jgi:hypothetical protein
LMIVAAQRVLGLRISSTLGALWPGAVAAVGVVVGAGAVRISSGLPPILVLIGGTVCGSVGAVIALAVFSRGTLREVWSIAVVLRKSRLGATGAPTAGPVSSRAEEPREAQPGGGYEGSGAPAAIGGADRVGRRSLPAWRARGSAPRRSPRGPSRPRHHVPRAVFVALRPLFRYSYQREAWILVGVGERYGPVLRSAHGDFPAKVAAARHGWRLVSPRRPAGSWPRLAALLLTGVLVAALLGFTIARATGGGHSTPAPVKHGSGTVLPAGPSSTYATGLNAALSKLNAVRSSAGSQLRSARDAAAQAKAADVLAAAHAAAASELLRLDAGAAAAANSAVATALRMTADDYRALALAAASGNAGGYSAASSSLTRAAQALNSALARLSGLGYQVT